MEPKAYSSGRARGQPREYYVHMAKDEAKQRREQKIQRQLDEALKDSFPASDPVSIVTSHEEEDWGEPDEPAGDADEAQLREPSAPKPNPPGSRS